MTKTTIQLRRNQEGTRDICVEILANFTGEITKSTISLPKKTTYNIKGSQVGASPVLRKVIVCYNQNEDGSIEISIDEENGSYSDKIIIEGSDTDAIIIEGSDTDGIIIEESDIDGIIIKVPRGEKVQSDPTPNDDSAGESIPDET